MAMTNSGTTAGRVTRIATITCVLTGLPGIATAQLAACDQVGGDTVAMNAPNGCINRTLADQVGNGHGDEFTPGSAVYLIKRDPARAIRRGRQLFQRKFTIAEGVGPRVTADSIGDITDTRALGAGLADSCAACHGRPRGAAGFGGDVVTFPDSRDAPHLFGLGLVEMLGDEMTADLRTIRDEAIDVAVNGASDSTSGGNGSRKSNRSRKRSRDRTNDVAEDGSVTRQLTTKGVDFGTIRALPDGSVDASGVEGVDEDLRVKPFFHHGGMASIREFIIGAFRDEMGLQAWDPILCAATDPVSPQFMISPSGYLFDPAADEIARPPACDAGMDPDGDGVPGEIDPALVDHMEFYLLNYFKPAQYRTSRHTNAGRELMETIGCTDCHVPDLVIDRDRRVADVETGFDPERGIFNDLFAEASTRFQVVNDGGADPLVLPEEQRFVVRNFFSDLKRHDLGPNFHERDFDGSRITEHVTEPLWGVGSTAPYGHDGRSINLDAVIRRHGGEARRAAAAYRRLDDRSRDQILDFLNTLVLFPPDDTASNLNPGDPLNPDTQDPANHGNINLGALFQIPAEGPE
jgi:hypothetical protein